MKHILIVQFLLIFNTCLGQVPQQDITSKIIGTWVSEKDTNWTIEFTNEGVCYWNYPNEERDTFTYTISTTSPQCGYQVISDGTTYYYLKLENQEGNDSNCYEILGVNNQSLSLSTIGLGVKNLYFSKQ